MKKQNQILLSDLKYVKKLVDQLVGDFRAGSSVFICQHTFDIDGILDGRLHIMLKLEARKAKDCAVCSNQKIKGGRRKTIYYCDTCPRKPGLHIGMCFEQYHTLSDFKI